MSQGAYSRSYARSMNQPIKKQGAPDRRLILLLYFLYAQCRIQKARGSRLTSRSTLILFTRAVPRTKNKGLQIDVPFYTYTFYTHSATYKKYGAPDRCPILLLYFLHTQYHAQKARGSRSEHHYTFRTQLSLMYEKRGHLYISSINQVISRFHSAQIYKLTIVICRMRKHYYTRA
jgi:hypothetical protein